MRDTDHFSLNSSDGTELFGYSWPADRPKAVMSLVHGFGEHAGRYADMAAFLNGQGVSVVALDLRGHGRSEGKRGVSRGMGDYRADLNALLEKSRALYPGLPHIVYGHSMGGGIVLHYGFQPGQDIRGMIASAPLIMPADPVPGHLRLIVKFIKMFLPNGAMSQPIDGTKVSSLPQEQKAYEQDPLNHGRMGFGTAVGIIEAGEDTARKAARWSLPLLLMHAKGDQLTRFSASEAFASVAKNVTFKAYDNVEHEMHNDVTRPEIYAAMAEFIKDRIG